MKHSSKTAQHYTPKYIADAVREVFGVIDLDPASCHKANTIIRASSYYTEDGQNKSWHGKVFVNPPGTCELKVCGNKGKCSCKLVQQFWEHAVVNHTRSDLSIIWLGFNVSQLQVLQKHAWNPLDFTTCIFNHRVKYLDDSLEGQKSPPYNSYITIMTKSIREEVKFYHAFKDMGAIIQNASSWLRAIR